MLRSGESRSQTLPHLQIIAPELFGAAQHIRTSRANSAEQERRVPLNTRGQSLLAGNVFCDRKSVRRRGWFSCWLGQGKRRKRLKTKGTPT